MNDSWEKRMEIFERFYREKEEKERIKDFKEYVILEKYIILEKKKEALRIKEEFLKEDEMQI